jgi:hypothetical protein
MPFFRGGDGRLSQCRPASARHGKRADIELHLDDFGDISAKTPFWPT